MNEYHRVRQSCSIEKLLDIQDEIAIRTLTLATFVGDYKQSYNGAYFNRRIAIAKKSIALQNKGSKMGAADSQALIDNADKYEVEQAHESTAVSLDLILRATNTILDAIQQRISFMKQEKMITRQQNQT